MRSARSSPQITPARLRYATQQLFSRAGVVSPATLPVRIFYGEDSPGASSDSIHIVVKACAPDAWTQLLQRPPHSISWVPLAQVLPEAVSVPLLGDIPLLFVDAAYQETGQALIEQPDAHTLVFHVDVIAAALFMLTRWEETVIPDRDEHGRFPATASVAYQQHFLDRPIIDEYALILQAWLKALRPNWEPAPRRFSIKLTHDIDHTRPFPDGKTALRTIAHYVIRQKDVLQTYRAITDALAQIGTPQATTYFRGIQRLAELSERHQIGGDAFYFMAADASLHDSGYDPARPPVKTVIAALQSRGFEVGLHAGYNTLNQPQKLAQEKARLEKVLGTSDFGGRQHYLRFQTPDTWRHWEAAGLVYDATMGYPEAPGFRCGTCHPFHPFDLAEDREIDVWEHPLIAMDRTLVTYLELTPVQAQARILELACRCKDVGGEFTLLWHNSSLDYEWAPWGCIYTQVLEALRAL